MLAIVFSDPFWLMVTKGLLLTPPFCIMREYDSKAPPAILTLQRTPHVILTPFSHFFYFFLYSSAFHFGKDTLFQFRQVHFWMFPNKENAISVSYLFRQCLTYCICGDFSTVTPTYYICFWGRKIPPIQ